MEDKQVALLLDVALDLNQTIEGWKDICNRLYAVVKEIRPITKAAREALDAGDTEKAYQLIATLEMALNGLNADNTPREGS